MGGEMDEGESVDALGAVLEGRNGEFVGGGAGGSEDQDFALAGVGGKKVGGALKELGSGAATEERASGHTQLLRCWWLVAGGWLLVAGGWLLVAGCWWLVAGGWLLVVVSRLCWRADGAETVGGCDHCGLSARCYGDRCAR
jgi:hypothetical protein